MFKWNMDPRMIRTFELLSTTTGLGGGQPHERNGDELLLTSAPRHIAGPTSFGFDYTYFNRNPPREDLAVSASTRMSLPSGFSNWNRMNNEVRARLDASFTGHRPELLGPLALDRTIGHNRTFSVGVYRIDLTYDCKFNTDNSDPTFLTERPVEMSTFFSATSFVSGKSSNVQPFAVIFS